MISAVNNSSLNSVIPQPAPRRKPSETTFCSQKQPADTFEKPQKESFLHKYRGIIGFLAGSLVGDILCNKFIYPKIKNLTFAKEMLVSLPILFATGIAGQIAAQKIGENK